MELYKKYNVYVVSDEIWSDIILSGHRHIPTQSISEDARMRTAALYAPSKTFNLAGLIGSYHIVYDPWWRDRIAKESSLCHYNSMNVLSMHALIGAYRPEGYVWADELCETCLTRLEKNPMRILDCKSPICAGIAKDAPIILDYLCDDCRTHFKKLQEYLKALNIDFTINPKIVRGLDYYTKTVFEFVTTDIGAQGTVCGGGRYDGLIEQMGGKPTPAMGFAMGLERLILTMESQGCDFEEPKSCDLYIAPMDESAVPLTMQLGQQLRTSGYQVEYDVMQRGLKAQMKYANKIGASFVMVLGGNELAEKKAKLKNMETGEQTEIALDETFEENFDDIAVQYMFHDIVEDFEKECQ